MSKKPDESSLEIYDWQAKRDKKRNKIIITLFFLVIMIVIGVLWYNKYGL